MKHFALVLALSFMELGTLSPVYAEECPTVDFPLKGIRQDGPTCLVATAMGVMNHWNGEIKTVKHWARELPLWPDGIDWFDLANLLEKAGWNTLLFTGPPEAAGRLVEAGFPVVAMTLENGQTHALTLHGIQRMKKEKRACGAVKRLRVMNPSTGRSTWQSAAKFEAAQSGQRLMLVYPPQATEALEMSRFPLEIARKVNRRIRAQSLLKRAEKHHHSNRQKLSLLQRATNFDPCWMPAHRACEKTATDLKLEKNDHCAPCATHLHLDPDGEKSAQ